MLWVLWPCCLWSCLICTLLCVAYSQISFPRGYDSTAGVSNAFDSLLKVITLLPTTSQKFPKHPTPIIVERQVGLPLIDSEQNSQSVSRRSPGIPNLFQEVCKINIMIIIILGLFSLFTMLTFSAMIQWVKTTGACAWFQAIVVDHITVIVFFTASHSAPKNACYG
jgi:hypothetical protein